MEKEDQKNNAEWEESLKQHKIETKKALQEMI